MLWQRCPSQRHPATTSGNLPRHHTGRGGDHLSEGPLPRRRAHTPRRSPRRGRTNLDGRRRRRQRHGRRTTNTIRAGGESPQAPKSVSMIVPQSTAENARPAGPTVHISRRQRIRSSRRRSRGSASPTSAGINLRPGRITQRLRERCREEVSQARRRGDARPRERPSPPHPQLGSNDQLPRARRRRRRPSTKHRRHRNRLHRRRHSRSRPRSLLC